MNVSYRWLRSLAPDIEDAPARIAERLAMYGAPVDEVVDVGRELSEIVIARVVEARPHPNADRLSLCRVDAGSGEPLSVVCGAPNVRAGAYYPFAPVGSTLPGGFAIGRRRIRGEESQGMLCSARELGLGRDHEGILELHGTFEPGARFTEAVELDDVRFVVDVTPNRPDLLSHIGIARELAPGGAATLRLPAFGGGAPDVAFVEHEREATAEGVTVRVEDPAACPRYIGLVIRDVTIGSSPEWLASRLRAVGLRPINNVVDATNFVLHELGQPLHAFDLGKLGDTVVVRRARQGEALKTLDGVARRLDDHVLVIADAERAVALAGIMGGEDTEVTGTTRDLLLECALFDAKTVRGGRRSLGLSSDASYRFERGVDPELQERAVRRCAELIAAIAGGAVAATASNVGPPRPSRARITLRRSRVEQVLGVPFESDGVVRLLKGIGFAATNGGETLEVEVPGHRSYDVAREDDLIEEVARRHGYDAFPDDLRPFRPSAVPPDAMAILEDRIRTVLVARGFLEARSAPLGPASDGDVALLLPLSSTESHLRRAILPGLLRRVEANFNRGARDVRLFEIGTVFQPDGPDGPPLERTTLSAVFTGARTPPHWTGGGEPFDAWDLKAVLQEVGELVGGVVAPEPPPGTRLIDAGEAWTLLSHDDRPLGGGGRVVAAAVDAPDWAEALYGMEITIEPSAAEGRVASFAPLPSFPAVERDLALVVPHSITASATESVIRSAAGPLLEHVAVFDLYEGAGIQPDARSIGFRLRFRSAERTLTDEEVDGVVDGILHRLRDEHDIRRR